MTINPLYHKLLKQIDQLVPSERITRKRVLAWLMATLFVGRSSYASRLSNKMPGRAKKSSKAARFHRWLKNKAIRVRIWYEPIARQLIEQASQSGKPIRLIVDGTRIGAKHQLLMIAVAYRRRALPIAWMWVKKRRGHTSAQKQIALFAYVHSLIPDNNKVVLLGDSEFGSVTVIKQLESWSWNYVLRQKGRHLIQKSPDCAWQRIDTLLSAAGEKLWLQDVSLTQKHAHQSHLLLFWKAGEKDPWFLATNLSKPAQALQHYSRRMWIEEMFGDFKRNGFDLESIRLRHFLRLSRFTMVVALLYVWVVAFGEKTIKRGKRHLVDRPKQRQLSIFRIGYDMLERCLTNGDPFNLRMIPYF